MIDTKKSDPCRGFAKQKQIGVKYGREGGPENPVWHINKPDWYPGTGDGVCTTIGYCSRIFRPERVSDERPDERMICCVCLAVEKMRENA